VRPTDIFACTRLHARHVLGALSALAVLYAAEPRAAACGGCFHPPQENPTVVTDHRMIFAISPKQTTLYDQMRYTGSPSSFAWVLPIAEKVTIGLSSEELFNAIDAQTSVQVIAPPSSCFVPQSCLPAAFPPSAVAAVPAPGGGGGGVTVLAHEVVGPYETVQLRATDPKALSTWLAAHHYEITPEAQTIIDAYVKEKSAFLAMKLVPGATVQSMRPVRVTAPGAGVTLPLRMVAAGAGATLGVTLWVVSEGRYEPQNFPVFTIGAEDVEWDWKTSSSSYATVRAAKTKASDSLGWQIESSLDVQTAGLANPVYQPFVMPVAPAQPKPARVDGGKTDEQERAEDLDVLCGSAAARPATVRVTRMRADLSHAALAKDLRVQASANQAMLSNVVQVTREKAPEMCAVYDAKCNIVGSAPRPEANAKNQALSNPQRDNGIMGGKKSFCATTPGSANSSAYALFVAASIGLGAFARRRRA
jgi:MYXO-CTERM domain-containing protein